MEYYDYDYDDEPPYELSWRRRELIDALLDGDEETIKRLIAEGV
jgi:hypothetical protein